MSDDITKTLLEQTLHENDGVLPSDVAILESILQQEGIDITSRAFDSNINDRMSRIDKEHNEREKNQRVRPNWVYRVRALMLGVKDIFSLVSAFVIEVLFPFVALFLFYLVEIETANLGIRTFFQDPEKSHMLATVIVTGYFVVVWLVAKASYKSEVKPKLRFTFANIISRILYTMGLTAFNLSIKSRPFSIKINRKMLMSEPTSKYESILFFEIMSAILIALMGTLGRLSDELTNLASQELPSVGVNGTPRVASELITLYNDSSLLQWLEYATSFFVVIVLLYFTHLFIKHIYGIYLNVVGRDELDFFDYASSEGARNVEKENARIQFYKYNIQKIIEKQQKSGSKPKIGHSNTHQISSAQETLQVLPTDIVGE